MRDGERNIGEDRRRADVPELTPREAVGAEKEGRGGYGDLCEIPCESDGGPDETGAREDEDGRRGATHSQTASGANDNRSGREPQTRGPVHSGSYDDGIDGLASLAVEEIFEPISDYLFSSETLPARVLHVALDGLQIIAVAMTVLYLFDGLASEGITDPVGLLSHGFHHSTTFAWAVVACVLLALFVLWASRRISRYLMGQANRHLIVAILLDVAIVWCVGWGPLSFLVGMMSDGVHSAISLITQVVGL